MCISQPEITTHHNATSVCVSVRRARHESTLLFHPAHDFGTEELVNLPLFGFVRWPTATHRLISKLWASHRGPGDVTAAAVNSVNEYGGSRRPSDTHMHRRVHTPHVRHVA